MAKKRVHRPEGSRPIEQASGRERPPGTPGTKPGKPRSTARQRFERASAPMLTWMASMPTFLIPTLLAVLLLLGLVVPSPWAGLLLVPIAAFLVWLTAVSWPVISRGSRALRLVVDVGLVVLAVLKLLGRI